MQVEIIGDRMKYVNPGKTQEWIDRGINIVMGKREGYAFWDMNGKICAMYIFNPQSYCIATSL